MIREENLPTPTKRQVAIEWWNNISYVKQHMAITKWLNELELASNARSIDSLTGREIENLHHYSLTGKFLIRRL